MRILNIAFIVLGIPLLISGIIEINSQVNGDFLGFQLNHPWYGILHFIMGLMMLLAAIDYFRKKSSK
jgi:uncharacterized membrane protein HdeD (DUF308 family)